MRHRAGLRTHGTTQSRPAELFAMGRPPGWPRAPTTLRRVKLGRTLGTLPERVALATTR